MGEGCADVPGSDECWLPQYDGDLWAASADGFLYGPTSAEYQGDYIVECLEYLRSRGLTRIEPTREAEETWRSQCSELAQATLFPKADSWYMGANVPGKVRELLMFFGGLPMYLKELRDSAARGYAGYTLD